MNRNELLTDIKSYLVNSNDLKECDVTENSSFRNNLGFDSLDMAKVVMDMEERYGITISDESYAELENDIKHGDDAGITVGDLVDLVYSQMQVH